MMSFISLYELRHVTDKRWEWLYIYVSFDDKFW